MNTHSQIQNIIFQLKNIEIQFENINLQMKNMVIDNFNNQMQNMGIQMLNLGIQIINIGIETPNFGIENHNISQQLKDIGNQIQNIGMNIDLKKWNMQMQMNQMMMNQMMMNQMMVNNNLNSDEEYKRWNLIFDMKKNNTRTAVQISPEKKIIEAINMFKLKINCKERMRFRFNGKDLNPDLTINKSGLSNNSVITVLTFN